MAAWFWYAVVAAILYGAHQIFTKLAADRIGEGLGGFVVEATAALSILVYLAFLWLASRWNQQSTAQGIFYSVLTGVCVGAGTIALFLLFQKGGPLSAVPAILACGAALMAVAGILFLSRSAILAATGRRQSGNYWIALAAQVKAFRGERVRSRSFLQPISLGRDPIDHGTRVPSEAHSRVPASFRR